MNELLQDIRNLPDAWRMAWASRNFRNQFILSVMATYGSLQMNARLLVQFEQRLGASIEDPLQALLPVLDFSTPIFVLLYVSLFIAVFFISARPLELVHGLQVYALVTLARTMSIAAIPLEPPAGMVLLEDPVLQFVFAQHGGSVVTKDLFFSGHAATMSILLLFSRYRWLRYFLAAGFVAMGLMLVSQRVHFSYDVIAAPFVAYITYRLVLMAHQSFRYGLRSEELWSS